MVKKLMGAGLTSNVSLIRQVLKQIEYYLKRNAIAYYSHRKKRIMNFAHVETG
jgi:hypothetical protein